MQSTPLTQCGQQQRVYVIYLNIFCLRRRL
jgi:hypothetical protein